MQSSAKETSNVVWFENIFDLHTKRMIKALENTIEKINPSDYELLIAARTLHQTAISMQIPFDNNLSAEMNSRIAGISYTVSLSESLKYIENLSEELIGNNNPIKLDLYRIRSRSLLAGLILQKVKNKLFEIYTLFPQNISIKTSHEAVKNDLENLYNFSLNDSFKNDAEKTERCRGSIISLIEKNSDNKILLMLDQLLQPGENNIIRRAMKEARDATSKKYQEEIIPAMIEIYKKETGIDKNLKISIFELLGKLYKSHNEAIERENQDKGLHFFHPETINEKKLKLITHATLEISKTDCAEFINNNLVNLLVENIRAVKRFNGKNYNRYGEINSTLLKKFPYFAPLVLKKFLPNEKMTLENLMNGIDSGNQRSLRR